MQIPWPPTDTPIPSANVFGVLMLVCIVAFLLVLIIPRSWFQALAEMAFPWRKP